MFEYRPPQIQDRTSITLILNIYEIFIGGRTHLCLDWYEKE